MSRDLAKDKEKEMDGDTGECAISPTGTSQKHRPELLLSGLSSSGFPYPPSLALPNHQLFPTIRKFVFQHTILISAAPQSAAPYHNQPEPSIASIPGPV